MVDPIAPAARGTSTGAPAGQASTGRPVVLPDGWTVTVTDKIVSTVDTVRSKTTKPITLVARGIVYGLLLGVAGLFALVTLLIVLFRGLNLAIGAIPGIDARPGRSVWIVDLGVGLALVIAGSVVMAKGRVPKADTDAG